MVKREYNHQEVIDLLLMEDDFQMGSTRLVIRDFDVVIKVAINELGDIQNENEFNVYKSLLEDKKYNEVRKYFGEIYQYKRSDKKYSFSFIVMEYVLTGELAIEKLDLMEEDELEQLFLPFNNEYISEITNEINVDEHLYLFMEGNYPFYNQYEIKEIIDEHYLTDEEFLLENIGISDDCLKIIDYGYTYKLSQLYSEYIEISGGFKKGNEELINKVRMKPIFYSHELIKVGKQILSRMKKDWKELPSFYRNEVEGELGN